MAGKSRTKRFVGKRYICYAGHHCFGMALHRIAVDVETNVASAVGRQIKPVPYFPVPIGPPGDKQRFIPASCKSESIVIFLVFSADFPLPDGELPDAHAGQPY